MYRGEWNTKLTCKLTLWTSADSYVLTNLWPVYGTKDRHNFRDKRQTARGLLLSHECVVVLCWWDQMWLQAVLMKIWQKTRGDVGLNWGAVFQLRPRKHRLQHSHVCVPLSSFVAMATFDSLVVPLKAVIWHQWWNASAPTDWKC